MRDQSSEIGGTIMRNWDLPVDPDTDAVGDSGYGDEGFDDATQPESDQGDDDSDVGSADGADSGDAWEDLGFDLNYREED
jgi:hypothetical protein